MASPLTRLFFQVGLALLVRHLRAIPHPTARLGYRIALALSVLDQAPNVLEWSQKELPKLERELRKLSKLHPELLYAVTLISKLRGLTKE